SPKLLEWIQRRNMGKATAAGGAPMKFGPAEGTAYFEPSGWREIEWYSTGEEARRLGREMPLAWLWRFMGVFSSAAMREKWRRYAGYALLRRVWSSSRFATLPSRRRFPAPHLPPTEVPKCVQLERP